jgi:hypothetical protein
MDEFEHLPGGAELCKWYGGVPSFHDAEIIDFHLHRSAPGRFRVHAWQMTDRVDEAGCYVLEKHLVVTFVLEEVIGLELAGFNHQNVIDGVSIKRNSDFYELVFEHCWGLSGSVHARRISIEFEVGKPK